MSLFHLLHHAQNELTTHSRVGEAPIERENREWRERILDYWHWITLAFALIAGLIVWLY